MYQKLQHLLSRAFAFTAGAEARLNFPQNAKSFLRRPLSVYEAHVEGDIIESIFTSALMKCTAISTHGFCNMCHQKHFVLP